MSLKLEKNSFNSGSQNYFCCLGNYCRVKNKKYNLVSLHREDQSTVSYRIYNKKTWSYHIFQCLLQITFSRFGAIASNSSIKMMAGEFFSASSNALRRLLSDSPASLLIISGPEKMPTTMNDKHVIFMMSHWTSLSSGPRASGSQGNYA